ncbi:MAG: glycosyltransferase [Parachlamydiaceae bacterium]|nr:glycosyltransferase [Parachlamydiaceae bacterium]
MKVLLNCVDMVNASMAGPAIRYWELAKALSKQHEVTLITPNEPNISAEGFTICPNVNDALKKGIQKSDVVISQKISPGMALQAKRSRTRLILDAYAPASLEHLELFKTLSPKRRAHHYQMINNQFLFSFKMADAVICAHERQRDLWHGILMSLDKLTLAKYDKDATLSNLVGIVPFGLSSTPPQADKNALRRRYHLKDSDVLMLWGGGIWNWFDPLTLIKAVKQLDQEGYPIKLIFMGIKHPNENAPDMQMALRAVSLAEELGLINKSIFFNYGWTPYQERQEFLLGADIGVSTHFAHVETHYAFRTRMLDYLWAGLPIIASSGDFFADFVKQHKLGQVVPCEDVAALAQAIKEVGSNRELRQQIKRNMDCVRSQFHWEAVTQPLHNMIVALANEEAPSLQFKEMMQIGYRYLTHGPRVLMRKLIPEKGAKVI